MKANQLTALIGAFVENYHLIHRTETKWKNPLVAYASASDPLFNDLKNIVSPTHALPADLLASAETVIAFFIPFVHEVSRSNITNPYSSRQWAIAYLETNRLISDLNQFIHIELGKLGFDSSNLPATHNFDETTLLSDWSHKHVGYIAGLGKFGLHQMLITERGCSGRLGSIVTNMKLQPTPRPDKEFCLYRVNQSCRRCVSACPNGALQLDAFDRHHCYQSCLENADRYTILGLADVCGKCVTGMPCTFVNPVRD
jgi:epoxyqueuosine reductase QueG